MLAVVAKVTGATPGQGMVGEAVTPTRCLPSLLGAQGGGGAAPLGWGAQLWLYLGVLQTAGALTAHHGNLGLVQGQWPELKPILRGGWNGGGLVPRSVLQEDRTPVSTCFFFFFFFFCIFQTLQERYAWRRDGQAECIRREPWSAIHPTTPF